MKDMLIALQQQFADLQSRQTQHDRTLHARHAHQNQIGAFLNTMDTDSRSVRPPRYSGRETDNLEYFLRRFTDYVTAQGKPESKYLETFVLFIDGRASSWFHNLRAEAKQTWDGFKQAFRTEFSDVTSKWLKDMTLTSLKQRHGQRVDDHAHTYLELHEAARAQDGASAVNNFTRSLLPELQFEVFKSKPETLHDAIRQAKIVETARIACNHAQGLPTNAPSYTNSITCTNVVQDTPTRHAPHSNAALTEITALKDSISRLSEEVHTLTRNNPHQNNFDSHGNRPFVNHQRGRQKQNGRPQDQFRGQRRYDDRDWGQRRYDDDRDWGQRRYNDRDFRRERYDDQSPPRRYYNDGYASLYRSPGRDVPRPPRNHDRPNERPVGRYNTSRHDNDAATRGRTDRTVEGQPICQLCYRVGHTARQCRSDQSPARQDQFPSNQQRVRTMRQPQGFQ